MVVFADADFAKVNGFVSNLRVCQCGEWNARMLIEPLLSMLTGVCHLKKVAPQCWAYFKTRFAFTIALFNMWLQWDSLPVDDDGFAPLSIAQLNL